MCIYIQVHLRQHLREVDSLTDFDENGVACLKDMASRESGLDEDDNYGEDNGGMIAWNVDESAGDIASIIY